MRKGCFVIWTLIAVFVVLFPLTVFATNGQEEKDDAGTASTKRKTDDKHEKTFRGDSALQDKKQLVSANMPVYKPPLRGAPKGRVGGGTRGIGDQLVTLSVLVPDHVALTSQEQPTLYWYLSTLTAYPVELTVIEEEAIYPLAEKRLSPPVGPGIQQIRLKDYDVYIDPGKQYRWFVAVIPDADRRSKDVLSGGMIERVELSDAVRVKLRQAKKEAVPFIYAEEGIWYDALTALSELIDDRPDDPDLRNQRASLLEQAGLTEVTEDLMKQRVQPK
ncbi:MAG TPA: DUF928 domain-containing protein [Thermodesulfovibrionales bacterium]|nr:DUF928 domain-containing protein [Thermodesulfovibrionales bacterium]